MARCVRGPVGIALQLDRGDREPWGNEGGAGKSEGWATHVSGVVRLRASVHSGAPGSPCSLGHPTPIGMEITGPRPVSWSRRTHATTTSRRRLLPPGRISWNSVRVESDDDQAEGIGFPALIQRWRDDGDEEALRVAAQTMLLTPFNLSGPQTREAFDGLRVELGRVFLAASISEGDDRDRARRLLASLLTPESRRGPPQKLAVTQRNAIVTSYLAGVDDPAVRAERMSELENRILPVCKENLQWPDDLSIDLEAVLRSLSRRKS